jgi:hypothetical protein
MFGVEKKMTWLNLAEIDLPITVDLTDPIAVAIRDQHLNHFQNLVEYPTEPVRLTNKHWRHLRDMAPHALNRDGLYIYSNMMRIAVEQSMRQPQAIARFKETLDVIRKMTAFGKAEVVKILSDGIDRIESRFGRPYMMVGPLPPTRNQPTSGVLAICAAQ